MDEQSHVDGPAGSAESDSIGIRTRLGPIDAVITPPGSKSITNRAFLLAALASGRSPIAGALDSDDTQAMRQALETLGSEFGASTGGASTDNATGGAALAVRGTAGAISPGPLSISARDAGTVARFLAPVLTLGSGEYVLDASPQMRRRPMGPLIGALRSLGADIEPLNESDSLPIRVRANGLPGGRLQIDGSVSSQFLSALLLSGPLMNEGLTVSLEAPISRPYIDLTVDAMEAFGAMVRRDGYGSFEVPPVAGYRATDYVVEPDASAASYFLAAAAITRGRVRVLGLGSESRQGDMAMARLLEEMGARVSMSREATEVDCSGTIAGIDVDMSDISDLVPTIAVIAAVTSTPSRIRGVGFIRNKESNRIRAVADGLRALGSSVEEHPDGLSISPRPLHAAAIDSNGDHRIAMSFAVLGMAVDGLTISGYRSVSKTFPRFFEALDRL